MSDAKKKKGAGRKRRADSLRGRWQRKIDGTPKKMLEMNESKMEKVRVEDLLVGERYCKTVKGGKTRFKRLRRFGRNNDSHEEKERNKC